MMSDIFIKSVLQIVGGRQDKLQESLGQSVHVIDKLTKQGTLLRENQKMLLDNFANLRSHYDIENKAIKGKMTELDMKTFYDHLDILILSVQVQIDKLRNAILFLKAGVIDPYFVEAEELVEALPISKLGYQISYKDMDVLALFGKPVAVCDQGDHMVHIIFTFPMAKGMVFNLYENLIIPKQVQADVVVLKEVPRYFVISSDNTQYFTMETLSCFTVHSNYICKRVVTFNVGLQRDCITDLFLQNSDANCEYRTIKRKLEVHNVLNVGIVMFSSKGLIVNLVCNGEVETQNVTGGCLIQPPPNCLVSSQYFKFSRSVAQVDVHLTNKYPIITCCSAYFKLPVGERHLNYSVVLKSMHEIKTVDADELGNSLELWQKFKKIQFKDEVKTWNFHWAFVCLLVVVLVYVYWRLRGLCACRARAPAQVSRPVVHFNALREYDHDHLKFPF